MRFLDGSSPAGGISALMSPTCVTEPLLQQGLELAHVLEAQVESLEAGDRGLAEVVAVELPHGQANVTLPGDTQIPA